MAEARRVVLVDADVARSCGKSERPPAPACLEVLETILAVCHRTALPGALREEWERHASAAAWNWLKRMTRRGKLEPSPATDRRSSQRLDELRRRVEKKMGRRPWTDDERRIVRKDLHLVEAAVATGAAVLSRDDRARRLFARLASELRELKGILWINPCEATERVNAWLQRNAPDEPERHLGAHAAPRPER